MPFRRFWLLTFIFATSIVAKSADIDPDYYYSINQTSTVGQRESDWKKTVWNNIANFLSALFGPTRQDVATDTVLERLSDGKALSLTAEEIESEINPIVNKAKEQAFYLADLALRNEKLGAKQPFLSQHLINAANMVLDDSYALQKATEFVVGTYVLDERSSEKYFSDINEHNRYDEAILSVSGQALAEMAGELRTRNTVTETQVDIIRGGIEAAENSSSTQQKKAPPTMKTVFRSDGKGEVILHIDPKNICSVATTGGTPYMPYISDKDGRDKICRENFEFSDLATVAEGYSTPVPSSNFIRSGYCYPSSTGSSLIYFDVIVPCVMKSTITMSSKPGGNTIKVQVRKAYFDGKVMQRNGSLSRRDRHGLPSTDRTAPLLSDGNRKDRYLGLYSPKETVCSTDPNRAIYCKRLGQYNYATSCAKYSLDKLATQLTFKMAYTSAKMDGDGCLNCTSSFPPFDVYEQRLSVRKDSKGKILKDLYTGELYTYTRLKPNKEPVGTINAPQSITYANIKSQHLLVCRGNRPPGASSSYKTQEAANIKVISIR